MQDTQTLDRLFAFLRAGVTPWHAVAEAARWLEEAGYTRLEESDYWNLAPGGRYYVTRNGSSIVAWRVPEHGIGSTQGIASLLCRSTRYRLRRI